MDSAGKTNRAWHAKNRMPPKATLKERAAWHMRHAKHCRCREMPKTVLAYLAARKSRRPKS